MTKRKFKVAVTKYVSIEIEDTHYNSEFWREFNESISDRGGEDWEYIAEHIAWNFVQGEEMFIEGIGYLPDMETKVSAYDSEVDIISNA